MAAPKSPGAGSGLSDEQVRRLRQQAQSDQDAKAAESNVKADKKPRAAAAPKEPKQCECGCGENTKGGRFIPGHDARFHSRVKELERQGLSHDKAEAIAHEGPLTGKYLDAQTEYADGIAKAKAAKRAEKAQVATEPTSEGAETQTATAPTSEAD